MIDWVHQEEVIVKDILKVHFFVMMKKRISLQ